MLANCVRSIRRYDRIARVVVIGEEGSRDLLRDNNLLDDNTWFMPSVKGADGQKGSVFVDR